MSQRILIVDDEPDLVDVLSLLFSTLGYTVETATDGRSALEAVERERPDLVLMDIMMPRMSGLEALAALKGEAATRDIPVVMVTARAYESERQGGLEAGADAYVAKPFENRELVALVRRLLEQD